MCVSLYNIYFLFLLEGKRYAIVNFDKRNRRSPKRSVTRQEQNKELGGGVVIFIGFCPYSFIFPPPLLNKE